MYARRLPARTAASERRRPSRILACPARVLSYGFQVPPQSAPEPAPEFDPAPYLSLPSLPLSTLASLADSLLAHLPEEPSPVLERAGKQLAAVMIVANEQVLARTRGEGSDVQADELRERLRRATLVYTCTVVSTLWATEPSELEALEEMLLPLLRAKLRHEASAQQQTNRSANEPGSGLGAQLPLEVRAAFALAVG